MVLNFIIYFFIFVFGLATGSFLNSVIYRIQTGESFLFQRSYCPNCKKTLSWQDLIPLLSFLFLKGKCRYCKEKISWQYPLVEIATGIIFVSIFDQFSIFNFLNLIYYIIIFSFLIIIFVSDLKYYIIPDKIIYPAIAITFFYRLFEIWNLKFACPVVNERNELYCGVLNFEFRIFDFKPLLNPFFSAILAGVFFLVIVLISKGKWMGWGDPKFAFFMGLFLGFPKILVALFFSFFIGAIIGIGLIILKKKTLKSEIPFGPFLVIGTLVALFWGNNLINWCLNLFLV